MERGSLFNLNEDPVTEERSSETYAGSADDVGRIRSALGPKLIHHTHTPEELERKWRFRKELLSISLTLLLVVMIVGGLLFYARMEGITTAKAMNFLKSLSPSEEPTAAVEVPPAPTPAKKARRGTGSTAKRSPAGVTASSPDSEQSLVVSHASTAVVHPLLVAQVIDAKQRRILEGDNTHSRITVDWSRQTPLWTAKLSPEKSDPVLFREGDQTIGDALRQPQNVNVKQGGGGQLLHQVMPSYPVIALQDKIQGAVVMQATVDKDGKVANVQPLSGPPSLVVAAVDAVRQWRYAPLIHDGQPEGFTAEITVDFALTGK